MMRASLAGRVQLDAIGDRPTRRPHGLADELDHPAGLGLRQPTLDMLPQLGLLGLGVIARQDAAQLATAWPSSAYGDPIDSGSPRPISTCTGSVPRLQAAQKLVSQPRLPHARQGR